MKPVVSPRDVERLELVSKVHTLVRRSAQVVYELEVLEEEEKVREEVQEMKKEESRWGETLRWPWPCVEWKTHYLSPWATVRVQMMWHCVQEENETMRADHARSGIVDVTGSGRWCSNRAVPRNHECCHWRPRHALSPSNHVQSTIMNCPLHVPIKLYQFIITFPCSHFVHIFAPRKYVIWSGIFTLRRLQ